MTDFEEYKNSEAFFIVDAKFYSAINSKKIIDTDFLEIYATVKSEKKNFLSLENVVLALGEHYKKTFTKAKLNKEYIIFSGIIKKEE